jgi:hypothetical protein
VACRALEEHHAADLARAGTTHAEEVRFAEAAQEKRVDELTAQWAAARRDLELEHRALAQEVEKAQSRLDAALGHTRALEGRLEDRARLERDVHGKLEALRRAAATVVTEVDGTLTTLQKGPEAS